MTARYLTPSALSVDTEEPEEGFRSICLIVRDSTITASV
jgi:hypothetical protein